MDGSVAKYKFENLIVWQKSLEFTEIIYEISRKFPPEEKFGLQSQIRRACVSIALNIAEGTGRNTKKDFRRFLHDSLGSLREVVTCLHLALRLQYISKQQFETSYRKSIEISKMLYKLEQSLKES